MGNTESNARMNLPVLLRDNVVEVIFNKVDGTERVMMCTLNPTILPESVEKEGGVKVRNPDVQCVWDVDNNGWRSFRFDSVVDFKVKV